MSAPATTADRFWRKVSRRTNSECWPWEGTMRSNGYGVFWSGHKLQRAHRVAWELHSGETVPEGKLILHSCDNRRCCNPTHLRPGTAQDNADDWGQRVRGTAKLDKVQVSNIRRSLSRGEEGVKPMARRFGIDPGTVRAIRDGRTWKWLREVQGP